MNEAEVIARAQKAKHLLEDPLLAEAFENLRTAIFHQIENTPIRDAEGLHELRLMLKLLKDVRANLDAFINEGKVAAFRKAEREKTERLSMLDKVKQFRQRSSY